MVLYAGVLIGCIVYTLISLMTLMSPSGLFDVDHDACPHGISYVSCWSAR